MTKSYSTTHFTFHAQVLSFHHPPHTKTHHLYLTNLPKQQNKLPSTNFLKKIFAKCAKLESHDEEEINLLFTSVTPSGVIFAGKSLKDYDSLCRPACLHHLNSGLLEAR